MLPDFFFDWWFSPWEYAPDRGPQMPLVQDRLGQRDSYRFWCKHAHIPADLPDQFDPAWHIATMVNGEELVAVARLFGGLFAARAHDHTLLSVLPFADRKWCVSVAAIQPLRASTGIYYTPEDSIDIRGLVELACHLEQGFPGLWGRLKLLLPPTLTGRVAQLLAAAQEAAPATSTARIQRCWILCRSHVTGDEMQGHDFYAPHGSYPDSDGDQYDEDDEYMMN